MTNTQDLIDIAALNWFYMKAKMYGQFFKNTNSWFILKMYMGYLKMSPPMAENAAKKSGTFSKFIKKIILLQF